MTHSKKVFVAWDKTIPRLDHALKNLEKHPNDGRADDEPELAVDALMLQGQGGDAWDEIAKRIEEADEVLAFVDKPNANVGFEIGYALGQRKPVWLVHHGEAPSWTSAEPFRRQLLRPVSSAKAARALLRGSEGEPIAVDEPPGEGERDLVLCPRRAEDVREDLERHLGSTARIFDPVGTAFPRLPGALSGARRAVWILAAYAPGRDERDGQENAALAAIAGFLFAHECELVILRQKGVRPPEDEFRMHDFELDVREWERPEDFQALLEEHCPKREPLPAVPADEALAAWREHLIRWNDRLVPFFGGASSKTYGEVYVEREVATELDPEAPELGAAKGDGRRPIALEELVREHVAENPDRPGLWLVLGAPGSGKTTLLRRLCANLAADPNGPVPVLLSLAHFARTRAAPFDLAQRDLEGSAGLAAELARLAQDGHVWLFLDGLDEVSGRDLLDLPGLLRGFHQLFRRCPIVLTSRDEGRRDLGLGLEPLRLLDLAGDEPQHLLETWLPGRGRAVWAEIRRHAMLAELARNPWMLTLMAKIADEGQALPRRRSELLEQAIDLLLAHGTGEDGTPVRDALAAADLLPALALRLHQEGGEAWPKRILARHLRRCCHDDDYARDLRTAWKSSAAFLEDLGAHSGLLAPRRGPSQPWEFVHRSLRELLVARAWAEKPAAAAEPEYLGLVDDLSRQAQDHDERGEEGLGHWGEALVLLAGRLEDSERARALVEKMRDLDGRLGLRALVEAQALTPQEALELLFQGHWDGEDLLFLIRGWLERGETPEDIVRVVLAKLTPRTDLELAGRLHYALTEASLIDDAKFLRAWGREVVSAESVGLEMLLIPGGNHRIGSEDDEPGSFHHEKPAHNVPLHDFALARTPITDAQMSAWLDSNSSQSALPAVNVSWYAARLFCRSIGCELPTEAQWEAACRAGSPGPYWSGSSEADLDRVGWYSENSGVRLHAVGEKPAEHPYGLVDMHGNVLEWCLDWGGSYALSVRPGDGLRSVEGAEYRVLRGGSFAYPAGDARSAFRNYGRPGYRHAYFGFRPARASRPGDFTTSPPASAEGADRAGP